MMLHLYVEDGISRLQTRWPQAHAEPDEHGAYLVVVPGVMLPKGYDKTICTLLFEAPIGFPGALPAHFYTDIEVRLEDGNLPTNTVTWAHRPMLGGETGNFPARRWPQWARAMWWQWRLQRWNPNRDTLYTFAQSCRRRLAATTDNE